MSKHIFSQQLDDQRYEVQIGWDKPTQEYYGLIIGWVQDSDCEEGGYFDDLVWSNKYTSKDALTLNDIANEITQRGFTLPDTLLDNVEQDRLRNAVNEFRFYDDPPAMNSQPQASQYPLFDMP